MVLLLVVPLAAALRIAGALGVESLDSLPAALRVALAAVLLLTASARLGSRRADLVRMVPPGLPRPELLVALTGAIEVALAAGLLVERTAQAAAVGLVLFLLAVFPANVHAARAGVGLGERAPTPLPLRAALQLLLASAAAVVAVLG